MAYTWTNADGLGIKFGTDEAISRTGGSPSVMGAPQFVEVDIDLTKLSTSTQLVLVDTAFVPKNSRIEKVQVSAIVGAVSGGASTLDIGLIREDRTTELDYDGLVAALAKTAYDAVGETSEIAVGSTGAGALLGTTLANHGLLVAKAGTAVFTTGSVKVRVYFTAV